MASKVELRTFVVNLDVGEVHRNRQLPSAYVCWLGVADSTLPNKGTGHRALRGKDAEPNPQQVNEHLALALSCVLCLFVLGCFGLFKLGCLAVFV